MHQAVINGESINMRRIKQQTVKVGVNNQKPKNSHTTVDYRNYEHLYEYITAGLQSLDDEDSKYPTIKKSARQESIDTHLTKDFRYQKPSQ